MERKEWRRIIRLRTWVAVAIVLALSAVPFGTAVQAADELPGRGKHVIMGMIAGDSTAWFHHFVYKKLVEELGYEVELLPPMTAPVFHLAAAQGQVDFWANGWFPLYNSYFNQPRVKGKLAKVGYIVENGALQGYLIDKETAEKYGITNLEQLKDPEIAELFDFTGDGKADLVGCNPGWGCERVIDHQLPAYELTETVEHVKGQYFALMAQVLRLHKRGQPILYYTWTPNWTVNVLKPGEDVVWLNVPFPSLPEGQEELEQYTTVEGDIGCITDPCRIGWPANDIRIVANKEWLADNPAAERLFEVASIPLADISEAAQLVYDGATEEDVTKAAAEWIEEHRDQVDEWIEAARAAAE